MIEWKDVKAVLAIVAFYLVIALFFDIGCPILYLTGVSCAGCGMTRAWLALSCFDYGGAFAYHPLFWLPPVAAVLFLFRHRFSGQTVRVLMTLGGGLFVAVYLYRMWDVSDFIVVFHPEDGLIARLVLQVWSIVNQSMRG